jgi:hypothetical protein
MTSSTEPTTHSLFDALILWSDDKRLAAVCQTEEIFSINDLREMDRPHLGGARDLRSKCYIDQDEWIHAARELKHAWTFLIEDFQSRIQNGEIFLTGVQIYPDPQELRRPIPGCWASEFAFDFFKHMVNIGSRFRYVAVRGSTVPPAPCVPSPDVEVTPEMVRGLSDDTILELLEEHAKRVVENDAKLIAPGKISLIPILRRKMLRRAATKDLEPTLAAEMNSLAAWISSKIKSHPVPTTKSLENALRRDYRACKTQSKGIKP